MKPSQALLWIFGLGLAVRTMTAVAQPSTIVAPGGLATQDVVFVSFTLQVPNLRIQQVYGARHFPASGLLITELRFRPNSMYGRAFTTTVENIQFNLSTTTRSPDFLNSIFTNNVGIDDTVVFRGPLAISSQFAGPPSGPKQFDISVPLTTPFLYDPAVGNLLLEIRTFSGSAASYLAGAAVWDDSASRVYGSIGASSGNPQTGIDAIEFVYFATNPPPPALRLTRGPYLQCGTTSNLVVRWRTVPASGSRVQFGLGPNALLWQNDDATLTTEHIVTLTNLAPNTKYYYTIGSATTNLLSGPECCFLTAPLAGKPTRIWALGDSGTITQGEPGQPKVRDVYYRFAGTRSTDVWLMLGDNAYYSGLDDEYQLAVFDMYPPQLGSTPLWPTIGNHDAVSGAYFDLFTLPTRGEAGGLASGTKAYYSFDYGNIHFVCLDSETSSRSTNGPMLLWLTQDLAANTRDWTIAFWHQPPYSKGSHDSDTESTLIEMRENVVPILESYGVDLVLCGHSHNYERSYLLNGHYGQSDSLTPNMILDSGRGRIEDSGAYLKGAGPAAHQGAVYVVAGCSGWTDFAPLNHPAMFADPAWDGTRGLSRLGSMVIDIDGNRLDAKFLRETGAVDDHFTIIKGTGPAPFRLATLRVIGETITAQWKSTAGHRYQIEKSLSLENPNWSSITPVITATGATSTWTGSLTPEPFKRFFRVADLGL